MHPPGETTELCTGWRIPTLPNVGDYYKGPDEPAGYYFFGKPVYRTFLQVRTDSSINTVSVPWAGLTDLVDVWGCETSVLVTGAVQGTLHAHAFINAGTNGASGVRLRCKPDTGVLEVVSGSILEFGGSSEGLPFPDANLELVVFWTR
jgi:hypothetical protein